MQDAATKSRGIGGSIYEMGLSEVAGSMTKAFDATAGVLERLSSGQQEICERLGTLEEAVYSGSRPEDVPGLEPLLPKFPQTAEEARTLYEAAKQARKNGQYSYALEVLDMVDASGFYDMDLLDCEIATVLLLMGYTESALARFERALQQPELSENAGKVAAHNIRYIHELQESMRFVEPDEISIQRVSTL